jgi:hypothetical protein
VVPYAKVKALVGAGRGKEAESKGSALGDEHVTMGEWLCLCELVIGFAE